MKKLALLVLATALLSGCALFRPSGDKELEQFKQLQFVYGGVNASAAVKDTSSTGYKLKSASVQNNRVTFVGEGGMWGNTYNVAAARNYVFFEENGQWYGGFFEWGSIGRETRDMKNISGRYRGWDPARFNKATKLAFMITDKNATKRSNVIFFNR